MLEADHTQLFWVHVKLFYRIVRRTVLPQHSIFLQISVTKLWRDHYWTPVGIEI